MDKNNIVTVLVDATTGPTITVGQRIRSGERVGQTPEGESITSPISGKLLACQFDADRHLLCLYIGKES